jgi:hypothetical protein
VTTHEFLLVRIVAVFLHLIYDHYETLTWVRFLVGRRVQREKVSDSTGKNNSVFFWSNREFYTRELPGTPGNDPEKTTCEMSAIPGEAQ